MNLSAPTRIDSSSSRVSAPLAHYRDASSTSQHSEPVLESILAALRGIRYGHLVVSIQDGQLIQIDRTERYRLTAARTPEVRS